MFAILDMMVAFALVTLIAGNLFGSFGIDTEKAMAANAAQSMTYIAAKATDICDNSGQACPATLSAIPTTMLPFLPTDRQAQSQGWIYTPSSSQPQNCFTIVGPGVYDQIALLGFPLANGTYPTLASTNGNKAYLVYDSNESIVYQVVGSTPAAVTPSCT